MNPYSDEVTIRLLQKHHNADHSKCSKALVPLAVEGVGRRWHCGCSFIFTTVADEEGITDKDGRTWIDGKQVKRRKIRP